MVMTFVAHAQYDLHVPNISNANFDFDDLTVAALAPPNTCDSLVHVRDNNIM